MRVTNDDLKLFSPEQRADIERQRNPTGHSVPVIATSFQVSDGGRDYVAGITAHVATLPANPRKYGNEPVIVDGISFDSKWEAKRYGELDRMREAGLITDLAVHVSFPLLAWTPNGAERVCAYDADFVYRLKNVERLTVEDCKSAATKRDKIYTLKRKFFEIQYGYRIVEVERAVRRRAA